MGVDCQVESRDKLNVTDVMVVQKKTNMDGGVNDGSQQPKMAEFWLRRCQISADC